MTNLNSSIYKANVLRWIGTIEFNYLAPTAITTMLLRKQLKKTVKYVNGNVLDVGCGMKPYEQIFSPYADKYVGVDMVEGPKVDIVADISKGMPFQSGTYDTVICTEMLEHTPYPRESIREISRVVRTNGHIILSSPFTHKLHGEPYDYYRFSHHILEIILQEAGLEPLEFHRVGTCIAVLLRKRNRRYHVCFWRCVSLQIFAHTHAGDTHHNRDSYHLVILYPGLCTIQLSFPQK